VPLLLQTCANVHIISTTTRRHSGVTTLHCGGHAAGLTMASSVHTESAWFPARKCQVYAQGTGSNGMHHKIHVHIYNCWDAYTQG